VLLICMPYRPVGYLSKPMFRRVCAIVFVLMVVSPVNAPFHPLDVASPNAEVTPIGSHVVVRIQATLSSDGNSIAPVGMQPVATYSNVFRSRPFTENMPADIGDYSPLTTVIRF
jgi:hypothetical protein